MPKKGAQQLWGPLLQVIQAGFICDNPSYVCADPGSVNNPYIHLIILHIVYLYLYVCMHICMCI